MIRLAVRVPADEADVVLAELIELAPAGVEQVDLDDGRVEYAVYGPPGELPSLPDLRALSAGAAVEISTSEIAEDWHERWKQFHKPVLIPAPPAPPRSGRGAGAARNPSQPEVPSIRVRPPWEPAARHTVPGEACLELVVDPGQAFGTGGHASTRLCLGLLLELFAEQGSGLAALDVGTGSGVLAIAAARLGFDPVLGLDNERESVEAAAENAAVNEVELRTARFDLRREQLPWLGAGAPGAEAPRAGQTLVLANLLRPLLIELCAALASAPAALIAGGLLTGELDELASVFAEAHGMIERRRRTEGDWGALWMAAGPS